MNSRIVVPAALLLPLLAGSALAQGATETDFKLPDLCQKAGEGGSKMPDMKSMMQSTGDTSSNVSDATKGYMQAMAGMEPPMMQGSLAEDPDVAFNCAMIAHHKGAIAMAQVELKFGKDDKARRMAKKTIEEQSKEVREMTKWVEEHAQK